MASAEEPIVPIPADPVAEPVLVEEPTDEKDSSPASPKTKKALAKDSKKNKVAAPRKRGPPLHPPYFEMTKDAIVTLKERTGSSQPAITKFIEAKEKNLPPNFRKLLLVQLKKLVENGKLVKVKGSFKLPPVRPRKPADEKTVPAAKPKPKSSAAVKKKVIVSKVKADKVIPTKSKAAAQKSKSDPKAKPVAKAKTAAKPKAAVTAPAPAKKASAPVKKAASKRKAPEKPKTEKKKPPSKVAKITTRSSPRKKVAPVTVAAKKSPTAKKAAPVKKVPVKKTPSKSVKPKTVKSPVKKTAVAKKVKK